MSSKSNSGDVKAQIVSYLSNNGRCKVREIASGIRYSNGYVLQKAKELHQAGRIDATRGNPTPACIINGQYEVLTNDKQDLVKLVKKHAPSHVSKIKGMKVRQIQKYIRKNLATQTVAGERPWIFWV